MLEDFISKILQEKSHTVSEFLRVRKYQFDLYTEKEEYIKQKKNRIKFKCEKIKRFRNKK